MAAQRARQAAQAAASRDLEAQRVHEARQAQFATWRQTPDGQVFLRWSAQAQRLIENLRQADTVVRGALDQDWEAAEATEVGHAAARQAATRSGGLIAGCGLVATLFVAATAAACFWGVVGALPAVVLFFLALTAGTVATLAVAAKRGARAYISDRGEVLREQLGMAPGKGGLREPDYVWTSPSVADVADVYEATIADAPRTLPRPEQLPPLGLPPVALRIAGDTSTARLLRDYEQQRRGYPRR